MALPVTSSPAGSMSKEKEVLNSLFNEEEERFPVVEEKEKEIEKEVQPYIEKIEKEIYLAKPITDDYGQTLVTAPSAQPTQIVLPISEATFLFGLKQKVSESVRWLAEWCRRLIKMFDKQTVFRKEENAAQ
ncbi:MAG: hypothetical protein BWY24_00208 [Microgenomates group bacterium ADurb.Bin219]|nr:MAG: hypothetical protein BWY24_00208 [Microgenomates group bacterium ADurb.Bin219]HNP89033.1 hypothetical protein [Candidatus Woesebacteria bacterium]